MTAKPTPAEQIRTALLKWYMPIRQPFINDILALLAEARVDEHREQAVDRLEVIDSTGRSYVKGSIYGSPVKIEFSYQDSGKTLKIFVTELTATKQKGTE